MNQFLLKSRIKQRKGKIINISSIGSIRGSAYRAIYTATKAGVNLFTKSLALELGKDGIRFYTEQRMVLSRWHSDSSAGEFITPASCRSTDSSVSRQGTTRSR